MSEPHVTYRSTQQRIMAQIIAQISLMQEALNTLAHDTLLVPQPADLCLMDLISARLNEAAASAYHLHRQLQEKALE